MSSLLSITSPVSLSVIWYVHRSASLSPRLKHLINKKIESVLLSSGHYPAVSYVIIDVNRVVSIAHTPSWSTMYPLDGSFFKPSDCRTDLHNHYFSVPHKSIAPYERI